MVIIEGLFIGDEVCDGRIINTNQQTIAKTLFNNGFYLKRSTTVDDNLEDLTLDITSIINRSSVLICTGGLGPTEDDRTAEAVSNACNKTLKRNKGIVKKLYAYFEATKRTMPEENLKQADFPENATPLDNPLGTAPGFYLNHNNCHIFCCPGVPKEMIYMLNNSIIPKLLSLYKNNQQQKKTTLFKCIGVGESHCAEQIKSIYPLKPGISCTFQAKPFEVQIRLSADESARKQDYSNALNICKKQLKNWIYSHNEEENLAKVIISLAKKNNLTLSLAESCTGGKVASELTSVSGASSVLDASFISYSNHAKQQWLQVTPTTLLNHGAVSKNTVLEMATNLKQLTNASLTLSISGIAGPTGGSEKKPVGLVYFGLATKTNCTAHEKQFKGDRLDIQRRACNYALYLLYQELKSLEQSSHTV